MYVGQPTRVTGMHSDDVNAITFLDDSCQVVRFTLFPVLGVILFLGADWQ
jgi:hypothetical protein